MSDLTHLDEDGQAQMVDVSRKKPQHRKAKATGFIRLSETTIRCITDQAIQKGDVLTIAKIAGIQAAKRTSELVPLCHPIPLEHIDVNAEIEKDGVSVTSEVTSTGRTGVEMESLTAVSVALLTIYDMCKAIDKNMRIENLGLLEKTKSEID